VLLLGGSLAGLLASGTESLAVNNDSHLAACRQGGKPISVADRAGEA
jgi:hypothetical protein